MIIVTGASGGLGRKLIDDLRTTDEVVGLYHTRKPDIDGVRLYQVDVTNPASVQQFEEAIRPTATRVTLVNLAGLSVNRLAVELTADDWDAVVDTNLRGSFLMIKAMLRTMIRDRWGCVVNISSVVAETGVPGTAAYAASKSGLHGLTRVLAKEYARYNITVNCLALGYFADGLTTTLRPDHQKTLIETIPLRRFGQSAELAGAVRYLMSASYTTGSCLSIDGGLP